MPLTTSATATFENAATMTYKVQAYSSYAGAVKSAVMAIARFGKPVGILGWAGKHAQIINGYQVSGQDPATSSNFTVLAIYLTDPLAKDGLRNVRISNANFANGSLTYRFRRYAETDSPYVDPYTPGATVARNGWYGKWVILARFAKRRGPWGEELGRSGRSIGLVASILLGQPRNTEIQGLFGAQVLDIDPFG